MLNNLSHTQSPDQHSGNHSPFYAPYSSNTGFYYVRANDGTRNLFNTLLLTGDLIVTNKSHQMQLVALLAEHASLYGLRVKIWNRWSNSFPGGHAFHRRKDFMKDLVRGKQVPFIFHMSWTHNKDKYVWMSERVIPQLFALQLQLVMVVCLLSQNYVLSHPAKSNSCSSSASGMLMLNNAREHRKSKPLVSISAVYRNLILNVTIATSPASPLANTVRRLIRDGRHFGRVREEWSFSTFCLVCRRAIASTHQSMGMFVWMKPL